MTEHDHSVTVTRVAESDSGLELRVEVAFGGRVLELICRDEAPRPTANLIEHGPDPKLPYLGYKQLYDERMRYDRDLFRGREGA